MTTTFDFSRQNPLYAASRIPSESEQAFQDDYYRKLLPGLRSGMLVLVLVHLSLAVYFYVTHGFISSAFLPEAGTGLLVLLLSFWPGFRTCWQPVIFALFGGLIAYLLVSQNLTPASVPEANAAQNRLQALMRPGIPVIVYGFVLTRLQFRWFLPGAFLVFLLGIGFAVTATALPLSQIMTSAILTIASPTAALVYVAYLLEQTSRREFLAQHLLAEERNDERRRREQSDAKLTVLGQAIGGIVHDLGNPLATVHTGAETVQIVLNSPPPDLEIVREFHRYDLRWRGNAQLSAAFPDRTNPRFGRKTHSG